MTNPKMYIVSNMKLMVYLTQNNIIFKATRPDKYNSRFSCWLYEDTQLLKNAISQYKQETQQYKPIEKFSPSTAISGR